MTKLKIKVTKDILERSKWCSNDLDWWPQTNCAIALAVRDIFPNAYVERTRMYFDKKDVGNLMGQIATFNERITEYIDEFDFSDEEHRASMSEFEFEVEVPDEVIEKINIDELKPLLQNHPNLEFVSYK